MAIKGMLVSARLFPSSFKNILAGRQGLTKKDNVTSVLESILKLFLPLGPSGSQITDMTLQLLCILFKSREKPRLAFRDWLQRTLSNIVVYLNAIAPRHFDDKSGEGQVIDLAMAFDFTFDRAVESQKLDQLTFKDVVETNVGMAVTKVQTMYRILRYTVGFTNERA